MKNKYQEYIQDSLRHVIIQNNYATVEAKFNLTYCIFLMLIPNKDKKLESFLQ